MRGRGPKDWIPKGPKDWIPGRAGHTQADDLVRHLQGVVILGGKGSIDVGQKGPVYISIVHDGSGFNPGAAIGVDQNMYHDLGQDTLEEAFEILKDRDLNNEEHVRELREEWGDRWEEILTEAYGGKTWTFKDPKVAAAALKMDKRAMKYVEIEDSSE